jgi:hypothetical protein
VRRRHESLADLRELIRADIAPDEWVTVAGIHERLRIGGQCSAWRIRAGKRYRYFRPTTGGPEVTVRLRTITVAELCERVQRPGVRIEPGTAAAWLRDSEHGEIVIELEPRRYALTPQGLCVARSLTLVAAPEAESEAEAA